MRCLLLGTVDADGHVDARPVVVELDEHGCVKSWQPLGACETASTVTLRALLRLPQQTLSHL